MRDAVHMHITSPIYGHLGLRSHFRLTSNLVVALMLSDFVDALITHDSLMLNSLASSELKMFRYFFFAHISLPLPRSASS